MNKLEKNERCEKLRFENSLVLIGKRMRRMSFTCYKCFSKIGRNDNNKCFWNIHKCYRDDSEKCPHALKNTDFVSL